MEISVGIKSAVFVSFLALLYGLTEIFSSFNIKKELYLLFIAFYFVIITSLLLFI